MQIFTRKFKMNLGIQYHAYSRLNKVLSDEMTGFLLLFLKKSPQN